MFFNYPAVNTAVTGTDVYADAVTHCRSWRNFIVGRDKVTSVHEVTHGANSEVRNGSVKVMGIFPDCQLIIQPDLMIAADGRYNGFYLLENRAIKVPEPDCRKRDCAGYIPARFRGSRYNLYVRGQTEWDDSPLYLFDEWIAYINGAECAVSMNLGRNTDFLYAPIEFIPYGMSVVLAADAHGGLSPELRFLVPWLLDKCMDLVRRGRAALPWDTMDRTLEDLITGGNGSQIRDILRDEFNYVLTLEPKPPGPGPGPGPGPVPPPDDSEINPYV